MVSCDRKWPSTSASAMVVIAGRISMPRIPMCSLFKCRKRGRRPRTVWPIAPSFTHFSVISRSAITDTVPLQPGMARQVGARHRLMVSDQVQNDSSVDIPRCLTGGYLKVLEINPSHVKRAIIRRANYSLAIILLLRKELARMQVTTRPTRSASPCIAMSAHPDRRRED